MRDYLETAFLLAAFGLLFLFVDTWLRVRKLERRDPRFDVRKRPELLDVLRRALRR